MFTVDTNIWALKDDAQSIKLLYTYTSSVSNRVNQTWPLNRQGVSGIM